MLRRWLLSVAATVSIRSANRHHRPAETANPLDAVKDHARSSVRVRSPAGADDEPWNLGMVASPSWPIP